MTFLEALSRYMTGGMRNIEEGAEREVAGGSPEYKRLLTLLARRRTNRGKTVPPPDAGTPEEGYTRRGEGPPGWE